MQKTVSKGVRLPAEIWDQLRTLADDQGVTTAVLIADAVDNFLAAEYSLKAITQHVERLEEQLIRLVGILEPHFQLDNERMKFLLDKVFKANLQANYIHQYQLYFSSLEQKNAWQKYKDDHINPAVESVKIPE